MADTPKKLRSFEKRASPLSPGMCECVRLVPKNWDTDACNLRHRLVRFRFCTRTPYKIQDLYESISMPESQPLYLAYCKSGWYYWVLCVWGCSWWSLQLLPRYRDNHFTQWFFTSNDRHAFLDWWIDTHYLSTTHLIWRRWMVFLW